MTVDVLRYAAFTDHGTGGNPAGVVLDGPLTDAQMQAVARAVGYSETAFLSRVDGRNVVRFFSPRAEVDFCGHATIATAVALAERDGVGRLSLATKVGDVEVSTKTDVHGVTATLTSTATSTTPVGVEALGQALHALRLSPPDLDDEYPPHVAYAGNLHLLLGLTNEGTLHALTYDFDRLDALMAEQAWTTVHVFWRRDPATYLARNLFPPGGVLEDPATGAAAAAFGGYLRDLGLVRIPTRLVVLQGIAMGAPSRLVVDVDATRQVHVTGTATRLHSPGYDEVVQS